MARIRTARRRSRHLMAEINVVPYIDVMLVLLVIFMVTAPLITTGVKVNLPRERAGGIVTPTTESVVITVDRLGRYYLDVGDDDSQPLSDQILFDRLSLVLRRHADTPVLVRADNQVGYGRVVRAMVLAQAAGAADVGLITTPPERPD